MFKCCGKFLLSPLGDVFLDGFLISKYVSGNGRVYILDNNEKVLVDVMMAKTYLGYKDFDSNKHFVKYIDNDKTNLCVNNLTVVGKSSNPNKLDLIALEAEGSLSITTIRKVFGLSARNLK